MLQNGRLACAADNPCFLMDGTGTKTSDRWRCLFLTAYDGGVSPVAICLHDGEDQDGFELLLQCVKSKGAIENSSKLYFVCDAGGAPNAAVDVVLPLAMKATCWAHLTGSSCAKPS